MLTLEITNALMHEDNCADYSYVVKVNSELISIGRILGHRREDGWKALVQQVLDDAEPPVGNDTRGSQSQ